MSFPAPLQKNTHFGLEYKKKEVINLPTEHHPPFLASLLLANAFCFLKLQIRSKEELLLTLFKSWPMLYLLI